VAVPLSHQYFETGWKLCHSRVLYSMKSLHREVFEPILCATGCTSIFVRQDRKSTITLGASIRTIIRTAVRQLFWPSLAALEELSIPQSRFNRGKKCRQDGYGSARFTRLQQPRRKRSR